MLESQTSMQDSDIIKTTRDIANNIHSRGPVLAASALHKAATAIEVLSAALETAEARLVYINDEAVQQVREMRSRSNARADALCLLGWDGEGDPRDWAQSRTQTHATPTEALVHEIRNALIPLTVDLRRKEATMEQIAATVDRLLDFVDGVVRDLRTEANPKGKITAAGRISIAEEDDGISLVSGVLIEMSDDDVRAAAGMLGKTIKIREVAP